MSGPLAPFVPQTRAGLALAAAACAGVAAAAPAPALLPDLLAVDSGRIVVALLGVAFFFAPLSSLPLPLWPWAAAAAAAAWGGQRTIAGDAAPWLVVASAVLGSLLVVRAGERAQAHYLPPAEGEEGRRQRSAIRRQLLAAVVIYLAVWVSDGAATTSPGWVVWLRGGALVVSAAAFLRYLLLQAKFLGIPPVPPLRPSEARGMVPEQRWPVLGLMALVACTSVPDRLLRSPDGGREGALLLTSALLLVLAGLLFVLGLVRLQRSGAWPRSLVRRTSFLAGFVLALALAAVYAEMEPARPLRYGSFVVLCTFFLVVLPFVRDATGLFRPHPRASFLVAPSLLAIMSAPLTVVNGERWAYASIGFLFALAVLLVAYSLVVVLREDARGKLYLSACLLVLAAAGLGGGGAWSAAGSSYKVFLVALGFVLYALDLLERADRVAAFHVR